jgi:hypothetical protein
MLHHVALARTDVSEESSASIIRVTRIGEYRWLVTANVPSSPILVTLMMEVLCSSEMSVLTRATWHNIPEDCILLIHHCENLKSYIGILGKPWFFGGAIVEQSPLVLWPFIGLLDQPWMIEVDDDCGVIGKETEVLEEQWAEQFICGKTQEGTAVQLVSCQR